MLSILLNFNFEFANMTYISICYFSANTRIKNEIFIYNFNIEQKFEGPRLCKQAFV